MPCTWLKRVNNMQIWGLAIGLIDQKASWHHMAQGIELWRVRPAAAPTPPHMRLLHVHDSRVEQRLDARVL